MPSRAFIYVGTDDDIRSPVFSLHQRTQDWPLAKAQLTEKLVESYQARLTRLEGGLTNKLMDFLFKKQSTQPGVPDFKLHVPDFGALLDLETDNRMTIWQPLQLAPGGRPHPLVADKLSTPGFTQTRWMIPVNESLLMEMLLAWFHRRTICASPKFGSCYACYACAVSLFEQMSAVQEEGLAEQTRLFLLRWCYDELPSDFARHQPPDATGEEAHREEYASFVRQLTGVQTFALYLAHSPLAEQDPITVVRCMMGMPSFDQVVIEDRATIVGDLDGLRQLLRQGSEVADLRGQWLHRGRCETP
jgi:hypothetical protein